MSKHKEEKHPPEESEKHPPSAEEITIKTSEYEELKAKLKELEDLKEKMLRTAADFENAKKRLIRERDEFVKFSQENILKGLLPVLDNFERALAHAGEGDPAAIKGVVSGIQMVFKQFTEILKSHGLVRFETKGTQFDPHQHEAVGYVQEAGKEDEIVDELEAGYKLHDRLLRAAKVRIRSSHAVSPGDEKQEEIT